MQQMGARRSIPFDHEVFRDGPHGYQVADEYGGADGSCFMVAIGVGRSARSIRRRRSMDVQIRSSTIDPPLRQRLHQPTYLPTHGEGTAAAIRAGLGSDAFGMQTRAEQHGDKWILNGRKMWITNGAEAQIYVVFANANPSAGYKGVTAFVVGAASRDSLSARGDKSAFAHRVPLSVLDDVESRKTLGPVARDKGRHRDAE
jgi:alkylation response protein AidB-like acyl-CoA dehydrogenase